MKDTLSLEIGTGGLFESLMPVLCLVRLSSTHRFVTPKLLNQRGDCFANPEDNHTIYISTTVDAGWL